MKTKLTQAGLAVASLFVAGAHAGAADSTRVERFTADYASVPISFEANIGQADSAVEFLAHGPNGNLLLTRSEAWLTLQNRGKDGGADVLRLKLTGGNLHPKLEGLDPLPGKVNYFTGNDPRRWHTDGPTFSKVKYHDVYAGVDLIYYGNQQRLEYDFVVQPGVNPEVIALAFAGAESISLEAGGDLVLRLAGDTVRQHRPIVYQEINGSRKMLSGSYALRSGMQVGFQLGDYDKSKPLIIDPVLSYSGTFGGSGFSAALAIAADSQGNSYITGNTTSSDFSTVTPFQANRHGAEDAFIIKFDTNSALVYSTYLGSSVTNDGSITSGQGIAVDGSGNVFVTGYTSSLNFPTKNALQPTNASAGFSFFDAFVTELNPAGDGLVYSTYLGGAGFDAGNAIALDTTGEAIITGYTQSENFPTAQAAQAVYGGNGDAFVAKLSADGSGLVYSTYLGGNDSENNVAQGLLQVTGPYDLPNDLGGALAVDTNGNAWVTGWTFSTNFTLLDAFQNTNAFYQSFPGNLYSSAFITEYNPAGAVVYSTYVSGGGDTTGNAIGLDESGNVHLAGSAQYGLPTTNAIEAFTAGNGDGFVAAFDPSGKHLIYCTYLGGSGADRISGMAVNFDGEVAVTGSTESPDFPLLGAFQPTGYQGFFLSTNGAGSWKLSNSGLTSGVIYEIQVDPSNPLILYAVAANGFETGIFKSTNGGGSWVAASTGLGYVPAPSGSGYYGKLLALDAQSPGTIYVGGYGTIYKTTNGGAMWKSVGTGVPAGTIQTMAIDPATPTTVYAGGFSSGVYKSIDAGSTWTAMNTGLGSLEILTLLVDPQNPSTVYAGADDFFSISLYKSTNGGANWAASGAGLPAGPVTILAASPGNSAIYTVLGNIFNSPVLGMSTNDGASWTQINEGLGLKFTALAMAAPSTPALTIASSGNMDTVSWPDSFAGYALQSTPSLDPADWKDVLQAESAGGGNITVTVPMSGSQGYYRLLLTNNATASPPTLYLGTDEGSGQGILQSADGGKTWSFVGLTGDPINALAVSPADSAVLYAGLGGGSDSFISVLTAGGQLYSSSYWGGSGADQGNAIATDLNGTLYFAGTTSSSDFPTTPAPDLTVRPMSDAKGEGPGSHATHGEGHHGYGNSKR